MRKKLDEKLCQTYQKLFRDRFAPMTHTAMCWGFDCGDGWYPLIDRLCRQITEIDPDGRVRATQVKEKFGGLRFYITITTEGMPEEEAGSLCDKVYALIGTAEGESCGTCEDCGEPGVPMSSSYGWWKTLCQKCAKRIDRGYKPFNPKEMP